jgi:hypothetical protein
MNGKQLVKNSLNHTEPDRVPVDFGSTAVTGIHVKVVAELRDYFGLENRPVKVWDPYQMLGEIEEDLMNALEVSTRGIPAPFTMFGFKNENWKEWQAPWGQTVLVSEHFKTQKGDNGDIVIYPQGDLNAPPSGRMPGDGFFFDSIIRQEPLDEENLDPQDNLEEFQPLSEEEIKYYKKQAENLAQSDRAVVATVAGTAFGDIALVPAPFLKNPKGIRDIQEWYISTAMRQDYIHEVFSEQCDIALENLKRLKPILEDVVDILYVCGTDFGTQNGTFCSTDTYENLYAPYYKKINNWVHDNTNWKTFKHSCGSVVDFIPHFIDSGFDILNPVQCSAKGMDPKKLKSQYGKDIVFWGGGVDTQRTLPFGTPKQVYDEVLERCKVFAPGGGFVFNTIHNVQVNTPVKNVIAMTEAIKTFNGAV